MKKVVSYLMRLLGTRAKQITTISGALITKKITFYPHFVIDFENRFARYVGTRHGLTFCNGTSGIEAALFAIGVSEGDEVIVPSFTFHASIDPILNVGGMPVFVDIDETTLTASTDDIASKLSSRTKAIILVHLYGNPADVPAVRKMVDNSGIKIIEDASHAHGARIGEKLCGGLGDIGVFSLQGSKAVAAGEGAIVVTNDESLFLRMSLWGHFDRHAASFDKIEAPDFRYTGFGFKRRIAPLSVLVADADLDHLDWLNAAMNDTASRLDTHLSPFKRYRPTKRITGAEKGGFFYGYPILIARDGPDAQHVISALRKKGIAALPVPFAWHHKLAVYNDQSLRKRLAAGLVAESAADFTAANLPVTESIQNRLFILPRKYLITMGDRQIRRFVKTLSEI